MTNGSRAASDAIAALERAIEAEKDAARKALNESRFEISKAAIERVEGILAAIGVLRDLYGFDDTLKLVTVETAAQQPAETSRRHLGRLPRGTKTPDSDFRLPILQALIDLGGAGKVQQVLDRVEELMAGRMRPIDLEGLPSDPTNTRWRNTAQWERLEMVQAGLLRSDSPRGTWQITEAGRRFHGGLR